MNLELTKLVCQRCGWTWDTKSKAWLVSCPGCGNKVDTKKVEKLGELL